MRFGHIAAILLIATLHLLLPLALVLWTWLRRYSSLASMAAQLAVLVLYAAFIFLLGTWVFGSFYLRYLIVAAVLATFARTLLRTRGLPLFAAPPALGWAAYGTAAIAAVALAVLCVGALRSFSYPAAPVQLAFPFKRGSYAVFEGGNGRVSPLMNYHYSSTMHAGKRTNVSMQYAVDMTKLTRWGNDAEGFLPADAGKYAVFNQAVCSPCEGSVAEIEDQWPNELPWNGKAPYNVGNHIVITNGDYAVLMGHLQRGSFRVKAGDRVAAGQELALAGNSGWTSQPHLHLQAMRVSAGSFWGWEGLPVYFEGRNPVKNSLFFE
jgi:hypothetical protein